MIALVTGASVGSGRPWPAAEPGGGWVAVRRAMAIDFDAQMRLTEALLPGLYRRVVGGGAFTASTRS